jgi:hypothetical protein
VEHGQVVRRDATAVMIQDPSGNSLAIAVAPQRT